MLMHVCSHVFLLIDVCAHTLTHMHTHGFSPQRGKSARGTHEEASWHPVLLGTGPASGSGGPDSQGFAKASLATSALWG